MQSMTPFMKWLKTKLVTAVLSRVCSTAVSYTHLVTAMNLSMDAVFSKQIPEKERGRYSGIYSCSVNLGSMIASVLGGFFMQEIGESTPFYLTAVLLILTMLVFQKVLLTENK